MKMTPQEIRRAAEAICAMRITRKPNANPADARYARRPDIDRKHDEMMLKKEISQ